MGVTANSEHLCACAASDAESSYRQTARLLNLPADRRPSALLVTDGTLSAGVVRAVQERGLGVPHDIAVISFTDRRCSHITYPLLAVVKQPAHDLAVRAAERIFERQPRRILPPATVRLQPELALCSF